MDGDTDVAISGDNEGTNSGDDAHENVLSVSTADLAQDGIVVDATEHTTESRRDHETGGDGSNDVADHDHGPNIEPAIDGLAINEELVAPPSMPGGPLPSTLLVQTSDHDEGDGESSTVPVRSGAQAMAPTTDSNASGSTDADNDEGIHNNDGTHRGDALPVSVATLVQDGVVVEATTVDLEAENAEWDRLQRQIKALKEKNDRRHLWVGVGAVALVAIVAGSVAAGILVPRGGEGAGDGGTAEDAAAASLDEETTARHETVRTIIAPLGREEDNDTLDDLNSPRFKALDWIARIDQLRVPVDDPEREWKVRQRYVMALLYFSTGGEDWDNDANFVTDEDECRWFEVRDGIGENEFFPFGARCDDQGRIFAINIWWNNMSGTIPPELSFLADSLTDISLLGGGLSGTIPPELGKLTELRTMVLTENCLRGDVPESLFALSNLEVATFPGNRDLTGSLNGFCDGNKYKGNLSHMEASCNSCPDSPALVECDCCICCDIVTYNCCDRQGNRLWNHANIDLNAAGQLSSFDKPCVAKETLAHYMENKDDLSWITDGRKHGFN